MSNFTQFVVEHWILVKGVGQTKRCRNRCLSVEGLEHVVLDEGFVFVPHH